MGIFPSDFAERMRFLHDIQMENTSVLQNQMEKYPIEWLIEVLSHFKSRKTTLAGVMSYDLFLKEKSSLSFTNIVTI